MGDWFSSTEIMDPLIDILFLFTERKGLSPGFERVPIAGSEIKWCTRDSMLSRLGEYAIRRQLLIEDDDHSLSVEEVTFNLEHERFNELAKRLYDRFGFLREIEYCDCGTHGIGWALDELSTPGIIDIDGTEFQDARQQAHWFYEI